MEKENVAQEVADDLLTDPDRDAAAKPAPRPPQTTDAEPAVDTGPADDHGDER